MPFLCRLAMVSLLFLVAQAWASAGTTTDGALPAASQLAKIQQLRAQAVARGAVPILVGLRADSPLTRLRSAGPGQRGPDRATADRLRHQVKALRDRFLDQIGLPADRVRGYQYVPVVAMRADPATLDLLSGLDGVVSIAADRAFHPSLASSTAVINGPAAWAKGYRGNGQAVVILDTGSQTSHPFFGGRIVDQAAACYSGINLIGEPGVTSLCPDGIAACPRPNGIGYYPNSACGNGAGEACTVHSLCFHGTHVAGIAMGADGDSAGVANQASLVPIQIFALADTNGDGVQELLSFESDMIAALERALELSASHNIAAVNMSLGGQIVPASDSCDQAGGLKTAIDNLRVIGIPTVIAAGNNGSTNGMTYPGCISTAVSVGATDDSDTPASFSNDASAMTLYAPGVSVRSSVPTNSFGTANGTSMATPHVTGAMAVLKQLAAEQQVDAGVEAMVAALQLTGVPVTDRFTHPRIDLDAALGALSEDPPVSQVLDSDLSPAGVEVVTGSFERVENTEGYGGTLQRADSGGRYRFTPQLPRAGYYQVDAHWATIDGNPDDVEVSLRSGNGLDVYPIDQTTDGGKWNRVTIRWFNADGSEYAEMAAGLGSRLVADAVRWQSVSDLSLRILTNSLPVLEVDQAADFRIDVFGGTAPYRWEVTSGTLPQGLALDLDTGQISGTPTVGGGFPITVTVTDATDTTVNRQFVLEVSDLLFADDFNDGNYDGWTIVDQGTKDAPSSWSVTSGRLVQSSNIITQGSGPAYFGTYAHLDQGTQWTDYLFGADLGSDDDDFIGIMFRVTDNDNYYRVWWYGQSPAVMVLDKRVNGVTTVLAQDDSPTFVPGQTYRLEVQALADAIDVFLDGVAVFSVQDADLSSGTIGLYNAGNVGSIYDNVRVDRVSGSTPAPVNQAPEIASVTVPETLADDQVAQFEVVASDPDGDDAALTYQWSVVPDDGTLEDANTAVARYTPADVDSDTNYQVTIVVTDSEGAVANTSRTLLVQDAALPPLLVEDFTDGGFPDWTIVDEGTNDAPSDWAIVGGELVQRSNIITQGSGPAFFGTYAQFTAGADWTDYRVAADVSSEDDDFIGIMFRVTDTDNYYRLWWYGASGGYMTIDKRVAGVTSVLEQVTPLTYQPGTRYRLEVSLLGDQIEVRLDGQLVMVAYDSDLTTGSIALYSAGNQGSHFDNIQVDDLSGGAPAGQPPQIVSITVPDQVSDNSSANFAVDATDPDGDDAQLSYAWSLTPNQGSLSDSNSASPIYTPVDVSADQLIEVQLEVTDTDGLKASATRTIRVTDADALQTLLSDDFSDNDFSDWLVVDEGTNDAPSDWAIVGGELVQRSNIITQKSGPAFFGSYAWYTAGSGWTDYQVGLDVSSDDDDFIGVMVRVADGDNYYRVWWYGASGGYMAIDKRVAGVTSVLQQITPIAYQPGTRYRLEVKLLGNQIEVYLDGQPVMAANDDELTAGGIALYSAGNQGSHYDNILVEDLSGGALGRQQ